MIAAAPRLGTNHRREATTVKLMAREAQRLDAVGLPLPYPRSAPQPGSRQEERVLGVLAPAAAIAAIMVATIIIRGS